MKKVLVDTSVIVDFLRRQDKLNSLFYQVICQGKYQPIIPLITITELWAGKSMEKGKTLNFVEKLVEKCEILLPNLPTAKLTGEILRQTNFRVSLQDAQIAAQALENRLPLLTLNKKDFQKIQGIKFLSEND